MSLITFARGRWEKTCVRETNKDNALGRKRTHFLIFVYLSKPQTKSPFIFYIKMFSTWSRFRSFFLLSPNENYLSIGSYFKVILNKSAFIYVYVNEAKTLNCAKRALGSAPEPVVTVFKVMLMAIFL